MDIQKHIDYWHDGAAEDLVVAADLLTGKRIRHGLFLAELALEKILKAHVVKEPVRCPRERMICCVYRSWEKFP